MQREYEVLSILDPKVDIEKIKLNLKKLFGEENIKSFQEWGKKDLAYEINKQKIGFYLLFNVMAKSEEIIEFQRQAKLNKLFWRYLVINLSKEKLHQKPRKFVLLKEKARQERQSIKESKFNFSNSPDADSKIEETKETFIPKEKIKENE